MTAYKFVTTTRERGPAWLAWLAALATALAATLGGCGGGVGSGGTGGFASGPITGFGSVIVNDVRFDDASASVEDGDGNRRSRDELRLGMMVEIDSSAVTTANGTSTATATRIRFDSDLRGPVGLVDVLGGAFNVLGQRVTVDPTTVFDEGLGGLAALRAGTLVEVFAVFDPAGVRYRATRVAAASAGSSAVVTGLVNQVDGTAKTLRIGLATYSYDGLAVTPTVGQFVRLRVQPQPSAGRYTVLAFAGALAQLPDADGARLRGLVSAYTSNAAFSVNGRTVDASGASYPNGTSGMGLGARVEVQGDLRNGTVKASSVKVSSDDEENQREFEFHGAVESVNATLRTLSLRGLTISTARSDLRFENGTATNLVAGRQVEVRAVLATGGLVLEATRIKFE